MLPVALGVLSSCALPWCHAIKRTTDAFVGKEMPSADDDDLSSASPSVDREMPWTAVFDAPEEAKLLSWWLKGTRSQWLTRPTWLQDNATAIVTHAGKNNQEFIDMAVMLGISLKRHVPDYPRIAMGVMGMSLEHQAALKQAGWHIVIVPDWGAPEQLSDLCGSSCIDETFMLRYQDSMEKINAFRLPVDRVLFLDADTYVASDKLSHLLNSTHLPEGAIGMVQNGCRNDFNSGVMLLKPDIHKYQSMLAEVARVMVGNSTKQHDQPIINAAYKSRIITLDKKYNCMDRTVSEGATCEESCTEVVVSHFTGLPKPAKADEKVLSIVRKPSSPRLHCSSTNRGSCGAWSDFYCDLVASRSLLTGPLQARLSTTGACCHSPAREGDSSDCLEAEDDVTPLRPGQESRARPTSMAQVRD